VINAVAHADQVIATAAHGMSRMGSWHASRMSVTRLISEMLASPLTTATPISKSPDLSL
jgi:hypothetical protein